MRVVNRVETSAENSDARPPKQRFAFRGNGVAPAAAKRIAPQNSPRRERDADKKSVLNHRAPRVFRTGRREAAKPAAPENRVQARRNDFAVKNENAHADVNARTLQKFNFVAAKFHLSVPAISPAVSRSRVGIFRRFRAFSFCFPPPKFSENSPGGFEKIGFELGERNFLKSAPRNHENVPARRERRRILPKNLPKNALRVIAAHRAPTHRFLRSNHAETHKIARRRSRRRRRGIDDKRPAVKPRALFPQTGKIGLKPKPVRCGKPHPAGQKMRRRISRQDVCALERDDSR